MLSLSLLGLDAVIGPPNPCGLFLRDLRRRARRYGLHNLAEGRAVVAAQSAADAQNSDMRLS
jgi:hypothetical protein